MRTTDLFGRPIADKKQFTASTGTGAGRTRVTSDVKTIVEPGDAIEVLKRLADEGLQLDSCVTDPPYHLTDMTKRFGQGGKAPKGEAAMRLAKGFMGSAWDGGDIAFRPETWAAVSDVLRPGAFLVAFGGTRTYHKLASAIDDAGFIVQDMVSWLYGSGFPKRSDQLKPAMEPICLAYKPGGKRTMQVDECRIGTDGGTARSRQAAYADSGWRTGHEIVELQAGRWPANICHDGSDEVVACFPESGGGAFAFSGSRAKTGTRRVYGASNGAQHAPDNFGDSGSAARFFFSAKADAEDRQGSSHPTVKPLSLMRWLVRLVTPEGGTVIDPFAGTGSTGAAALLEGVDSILIERDDKYLADIDRKLAYFRNKRSRALY